jgi:hypothetical protein
MHGWMPSSCQDDLAETYLCPLPWVSNVASYTDHSLTPGPVVQVSWTTPLSPTGQAPAVNLLPGFVTSYVQCPKMRCFFKIGDGVFPFKYTCNFYKFNYMLSQLVTLQFNNTNYYTTGFQIYAISCIWHKEMLICPNDKRRMARFI